MKKLFLSLTTLLFCFALFSCSESDLTSNYGSDDSAISNPKGGNITTTANPAIVWRTNEIINRTAVDALWVMDADGANQIRLYCPSVTSGKNKKILGLLAPHWSPDGGSICFGAQAGTGQDKSLYKLNVTLVNGVPTATDVTKLLDAISTNAAYYECYWSFGTINEIIYSVLNKSDNLFRIQAISGNGGSPTTIYTGPTGAVLRYVTVNPDGSFIAFRESVSGNSYLKVINRSDGSVVYSIQTNSILNGFFNMDWERTAGSTKLAMYAYPYGTTNASVFTIDVTDASTLTLVKSIARAPSWSPDDSKLVYTDVTTPWSIKTFRFSDGATTTLGSLGGYETHWKK